MAYTQTGTPYYASPEVWQDLPYDHRSDMWSFGCILYEMCMNHPPFEGKDIEVLYDNIKKCKHEPISGLYSEPLRELITKCLSKKPSARPLIKDLLFKSHSALVKKCQEYQIAMNVNSTFTLIDTIIFNK